MYNLYGVPQDLENVLTVELSETKNIVLTVKGKVVGFIEMGKPYDLPDHETGGTYLHYAFTGHGIVEDDGYVYRHIGNFSGGAIVTNTS